MFAKIEPDNAHPDKVLGTRDEDGKSIGTLKDISSEVSLVGTGGTIFQIGVEFKENPRFYYMLHPHDPRKVDVEHNLFKHFIDISDSLTVLHQIPPYAPKAFLNNPQEYESAKDNFYKAGKVIAGFAEKISGMVSITDNEKERLLKEMDISFYKGLKEIVGEFKPAMRSGYEDELYRLIGKQSAGREEEAERSAEEYTDEILCDDVER